MVRFSFLLFTFIFITSEVYAGAAHSRNSSKDGVRNLYQQQCVEAGGNVNGFCMCEDKKDILELTVSTISVVRDIKKLDKKMFKIINPFVESCTEQPIDLNSSFQRLTQMHQVLLTYAANEKIKQELFVMDELDLFNPNAFSQYMTNGQFKNKVLKKIQTIKKTQATILEKGIFATAKDRAQAQVRMVAMAGFEEFTGINISKANLVTQNVSNLISQFTAKTTQKTVAMALKEMSTDLVAGSLKSLGKGFVAGVIMTASLEALTYATGFDFTAYDPFNEIFGVTQMGDGTISGNLNNHISYTLHPEFQTSLDAGFSTDPENFSSKMIHMALIAESRAKGQSVFGFLDE